MKRYILASAILLLGQFMSAAADKPVKEFSAMCDSIVAYLSNHSENPRKISVTDVQKASNSLNLTFSHSLSEYPFHDGDVARVYDIVDDNLPEQYSKYIGKVNIKTAGVSLESLETKFYSSRRNTAEVKNHYKLSGSHHEQMAAPLVNRTSRVWAAPKGLERRHIALWQSHGYYYEPSLERWEWQRGRLMETIEDIYTQSYVIPFLIPMLENAGANVLVPRERDWGTVELIVDNDHPESGYKENGFWSDAPKPGFLKAQETYTDGQNPFTMGTARMAKDIGSTGGACSVSWTPDFPKGGNYAVYVSYQTTSSSTSNARYEVRHSGGTSTFSVNQKMGGSTWIYLGTFKFDLGSEAGQGVYLSNNGSNSGKYVTADAVKFGGGMGNIARKPKESSYNMQPETSSYPRAAEASRYWLQWAGFHDTIYSPTGFLKDYNDDYQCRGKWVNALADGSYVNPSKKGYNIPVDLSFAFHTDAGIAKGDGTIGTLSIYTRVASNKSTYPNGEKRDIARSYADIVQTQIVSDIRASFDPKWSRRSLMDKSYSESSSEEVPAMLLEFLSHQNFTDMRFGLDPAFRFTVSRAIYKGMLKYLSYLNNFDYVVQPLPVNSFAATLTRDDCGGCFAELSWKPAEDSLEISARPDSYIVYMRTADGGFDEGVRVDGCQYQLAIEPGVLYSFKVTAVNEGGQSFPSEILSVAAAEGEPLGKALVINNFDRLAAPSSFSTTDSTYAGFCDYIDGGVPYISDISYCGPMFDFRCKSSWKDDDNAGFGASLGNYETMEIAGNTFDFPAVHGKAFMACGYDFSSASRDAFADGSADSTDIKVLDVICGKQITTMTGYKGACALRHSVFPAPLRKKISDYAHTGGNIIISGANIASDLWDKIYDFDIDQTMQAEYIDPGRRFVQDVLKYKWRSNEATATGSVRSVQNPYGLQPNVKYGFHHEPNTERYHVESPDALEPADKSGARTIFRYSDNNISAGVAYIGKDYKAVSLGFPIETLNSQDEINILIDELLSLFR